VIRRAKESFSFIIANGAKIGYVLFILAVVCICNVEAKADTTEITLDVEEEEDITTKLQSAVMLYDTVIIPNGTYYCSGVKLDGVDGLTIIAKGALIYQNGSENPILYVSDGASASNITIKQGYWDAEGTENPVFGFKGSCNNISLFNLSAENSADAAISFFGARDVSLENIKSVGNEGYGVYIENTTNISICDTDLEQSQTGIYLKNCLGEFLISGSRCKENTDAGVVCEGVSYIYVNCVDISNNGDGIRISGAEEKVYITGGTINDNDGYGAYIYDCTAPVGFFDQDIKGNKSSGIFIENCPAVNSSYGFVTLSSTS